MVRRLLAAVFAVLVLLVAFEMRRDEGGRSLVPGRGGSARPVPDGSAGEDPYEIFDEDEGFVLLCIEDLADLCRDTFDLFGFTVRTEPAWTTVERLQAGGDLGADVWLTVRPFPELAAPAPGASAALAAPTPVLARSPIAVAGSGSAVDALGAACTDTTTLFACLVQPAGPGPVIIRDPAASSLGALAATAVALELGLDPDVPESGEPAVAQTLRTSMAGLRRSQAPVEDAVRIGGSALALTVEAELISQLRGIEYEQREGALTSRGVRYPLDVRPVEIVAVPATTFSRPRDLEALLRTSAAGYAFDRHGWVVEGRDAWFLHGPPFEARPAVRTDLPWPPALVRAVRGLVAG